MEVTTIIGLFVTHGELTGESKGLSGFLLDKIYVTLAFLPLLLLLVVLED